MESGLQYMDDTVGTGKEVKNGDLVSVHFSGWIISDSTNLFTDWSKDSTRMKSSIGHSKGRAPLKFILGEGNFIKGTEEAITGMKVGGTRTLIVPSNLAYGPQGIGPIPPNSNLKVVISLIESKQIVKAKMWEVDSTKLQTTKSGLKYLIIQEGIGEKVDSGDAVNVHYSGYLKDGTKFDSSVDRDEPFKFVVGQKMVIQGWDEGLMLLKVGSKARLVIPPALGYGEMPVGKIPPNSTLLFDVELLSVDNTKK
jgi:peptidylprolyl isomerase